MIKANPSPNGNGFAFNLFGSPTENRTPDSALRGLRLNRLTKGPFNYLLSVAYFTGGSQDVKEKYLEKI